MKFLLNTIKIFSLNAIKFIINFFSKYNKKRTILLLLLCFVLATIALILGITKPETFHTVFVSVFFYIMALVFLSGIINMSDRGIRKTVNKIFKKNPNMNLVAKYIFNDENFVSVNGENAPIYFDYKNIAHLEIVDDYIIILKNRKFIALNTKEEKSLISLREKHQIK